MLGALEVIAAQAESDNSGVMYRGCDEDLVVVVVMVEKGGNWAEARSESGVDEGWDMKPYATSCWKGGPHSTRRDIPMG